jgi:hypothetical protein
MTMVMAVGCGNKAASTSQAANATAPGNQSNFAAAMTNVYTNALKGLVTAGTITQAQSDKVLVVLKNSAPGGRGGAPSANSNNSAGTAPTGTPPSGNAATGTQPSGTPPTGNAPTGTNPNSNRLSELVTSKVITQAQADTINQKIQEAMKNSQPKNNGNANTQTTQTTPQIQ